MYAITLREYTYDDGYWDFWTYGTEQEAQEELSDFKGNARRIVKVINLDESSPEADFVNKNLAENS